MNQPNQARKAPSLKSSAVTDRGLNQKRPLNEDSFLADSARGIFAVADGVGGAEAGEVASQTAIEVLDEAFRNQVDGGDIEDLMELAIQRANASIHQMAQENAKFAMMATTIVGLHIDGNVATIAHVGDSRLYRLTPAGQLLRETSDHSVVEEEVRAGRMTAEQAANHPSKNVISRALGAESDVDVDLKMIEVDDGTEFLLCTDGITRHIPDHELRQILLANDDLPSACAEMKQRCFERGAEDNLTAVVVSVGRRISTQQRHDDLEKTFSPETDPVPAIAAAQQPSVEQTMMDRPSAPSVAGPGPIVVPASRKAFPGMVTEDAPRTLAIDSPQTTSPPAKGGVERTMTRFFVLVLLLTAIAAAFYAGRRYKGQVPYLDQGNAAEVATSATPEDPLVKFERARQEVDVDPAVWLTTQAKTELTRQGIASPLESSNPDFLYFYGRASFLTGNADEAIKAFEGAIAKADLNPSPANQAIKKEATFGLAAAALRNEAARPAAQTRVDQIVAKPSGSLSATPPPASPAASPAISP